MMRSVHSGDPTPLNSCPASSWPSWHPVILRHHSGHDDSQVHLLGSRVIGVTICQVRSSRKICLFDTTFSMWNLQTTWVAVSGPNLYRIFYPGYNILEGGHLMTGCHPSASANVPSAQPPPTHQPFSLAQSVAGAGSQGNISKFPLPSMSSKL